MTLMINCQRCGQVHLIGHPCRTEAMFNQRMNEQKKQRSFLAKIKKLKKKMKKGGNKNA